MDNRTLEEVRNNETKLIEEIKSLEKQLEENKLNHKQLKDLDKIEKSFIENKNQQKKFIEYLENEIESCELTSDLIFNHNKEMKIYKEILSKYKEIIGGKDE